MAARVGSRFEKNGNQDLKTPGTKKRRVGEANTREVVAFWKKEINARKVILKKLHFILLKIVLQRLKGSELGCPQVN